MTENELKKLSKSELATMVQNLTQQRDELQTALEAANAQLADRKVQVEEAGTLAEATVKINGVLEAADAAAAQYVENIKRQHAETEAKTAEMMTTTQTRCAEIENETRTRCDQMIASAKEESQSYWDEVYGRLKNYCQTTDTLKDLMKQLA